MKTITIVGVGALGSHVALLLRNEGSLRLIDFDRIESKNSLSQFHAVGDAGQLKTTALVRILKGLFGTKAYSFTSKLSSYNTQQLLGNSDLIIDCLDNAEGRRVVQDFARSNGPVPCLHGGLAVGGAFGRVVWSEHFTPDEAAPGAATCEDGAFLPHIAVVSATIAYAAQRFLRDGKRENYMINGATSTRL